MDMDKTYKITAVIFLICMAVFMGASFVAEPPPEDRVRQQVREESMIQ